MQPPMNDAPQDEQDQLPPKEALSFMTRTVIIVVLVGAALFAVWWIWIAGPTIMR
jgi:hypothetical protein